MSIETFKILNKMSPLVLSDLVKLRDCTSYNFRYNNIVQVPHVRTTKYGKNSFKYAAAVLWNSFPDDFRKVKKFNQFKSLISKWNGGGGGVVNVIYVNNCLHMTVCCLLFVPLMYVLPVCCVLVIFVLLSLIC